MSASSVVTAPAAAAPTPANTRSTAFADARGNGATDHPFGRQLDAARQQHDHSADRRADANAAQRAGAASASAQAAGEQNPPVAAAAAAVAETIAAPGDAPGDSATTATDKQDDATDDASAAQLLMALLGPALATTSPAASTAEGSTQSGRTAGALSAVGGTAAAAADAKRQSALLGADASGDAASATAADMPGKNVQGQALLLDATPTHAADDLQTSASPASIGGGALTLSPPVPGGLHVVQLAAPVGTAEFGQELGRQITWMGTHDIQQARIRLHPEELGQVDLKISVSHGRVDVVFSAQHPGAVQALQQSLPQLGQMLNQQGLSLGHSEVGQHGRDDASTPRRGAAGAGADGVEEIHTISATAPVHALNLLDAFA